MCFGSQFSRLSFHRPRLCVLPRPQRSRTALSRVSPRICRIPSTTFASSLARVGSIRSSVFARLCHFKAHAELVVDIYPEFCQVNPAALLGLVSSIFLMFLYPHIVPTLVIPKTVQGMLDVWLFSYATPKCLHLSENPDQDGLDDVGTRETRKVNQSTNANDQNKQTKPKGKKRRKFPKNIRRLWTAFEHVNRSLIACWCVGGSRLAVFLVSLSFSGLLLWSLGFSLPTSASQVNICHQSWPFEFAAS